MLKLNENASQQSLSFASKNRTFISYCGVERFWKFDPFNDEANHDWVAVQITVNYTALDCLGTKQIKIIINKCG